MNKGDDMEMIVQEGIHFIDLQRLIFARRGKARSVLGLDPLAGRLRAGLCGLRPADANAGGSDDKAGVSPAGRAFLGRIRRIGRMVWNSEITVARWELLAVLAIGALAAGIVLGVASGRF
jgi:hypothetical protein